MAAQLNAETIRATCKAGSAERKIQKGLNEVCRALEQRKAKVCFVADDLKEDNYKKLVTSLAQDAGVPLIKVDSGKMLGEWVGLCKYNEDGEATKVVGCGSVVISDWPMTGGKAVEDFKAALATM